MGVATLLMFMALLTGVVTHRRIFKDFFTFRPAGAWQRLAGCAQRLGVLVLPFYLMITFSGLIFHSMYLPSGIATAYAGADGKGGLEHLLCRPAGDQPERRARRDRRQVRPLPLIPVATILTAAQKALGRRPHRLHPGAARCPKANRWWKSPATRATACNTARPPAV